MRKGMRARSLSRMDEIVAHYARQNGVLAIAAFGSNAERERFDDCSDLDFLVIVTPCQKDRLLSEVALLERICPIDGMQISCGDAVKLLFSDGVFCDFGIVTAEQLAEFPHGAGRYLWGKDSWDAIRLSASEPPRKTASELETDALFHLYVGLLRVLRGEEAAAVQCIQVEAAQCVLALLEGESADAFSPMRRAEQLLQPELLASLMPGYGHSSEAAKAMLKHLLQQRHTPLCRAVEALLG